MKNVVCFGEILWDVFPEEQKLGGAPFNVAAHLAQLGLRSHIITRVGKDELGNDIIKAVIQKDVFLEIQVDTFLPTGIVNVLLDEKGIPTYKIQDPAAWDNISFVDHYRSLVRSAEALVFGSLACRSKTNFLTLKKLAAESTLRICDLNIRLDYYSEDLIKEILEMTDILKINEDEAKLLREMFSIDRENFYQELTRRFNLKAIIKTLGDKGAEAFAKGQLESTMGYAIEVKDTVGSGDAFLAAFISHYLEDKPIAQCLNEGCKLGAYVATQSGAIPEIDQILLNSLVPH